MFDSAETGYARDVFADDSRSLTQLTIRELIAELTRVEDRLREDAHHAGPRPLPGQVSREAALRRRERLLLAELAARRESQSSAEAEADPSGLRRSGTQLNDRAPDDDAGRTPMPESEAAPG